MLKIEAIFRPERISAVTNALLDVGVTGFNYQNVTGQGPVSYTHLTLPTKA